MRYQFFKPKQMRKLIMKDEGELRKKYLELLEISLNLDKRLDIWIDHFGSQNRDNLETWRNNLKQFIKELNIQTEENS